MATPFAGVPALPVEMPTRARGQRGTEFEITTQRVRADAVSGRMTPEFIDEIRSRLARGVYSSKAVMTEVAYRMLLSGDL